MKIKHKVALGVGALQRCSAMAVTGLRSQPQWQADGLRCTSQCLSYRTGPFAGGGIPFANGFA